MTNLTIYEDITAQLSEYLQKEEDNIDFTKFDIKAMHNYLTSPEKALQQADINDIREYKNQWKHHHWNINIITLNYTRSIEKIIERFDSPIGVHDKAYQINLKNINHIHGYCDNRMVMGVNDISQISNQKFHHERDVLESIIKSECNRANKHTIDVLCSKQISEANLICIFGCSLGDTDNYLWEQIGEQLKKGIKLIIFTRGEEVHARLSHKKARTERQIRTFFLKKTKLNESEIERFEKNIYIGVNTTMFNLK